MSLMFLFSSCGRSGIQTEEPRHGFTITIPRGWVGEYPNDPIHKALPNTSYFRVKSESEHAQITMTFGGSKPELEFMNPDQYCENLENATKMASLETKTSGQIHEVLAAGPTVSIRKLKFNQVRMGHETASLVYFVESGELKLLLQCQPAGAEYKSLEKTFDKIVVSITPKKS